MNKLFDKIRGIPTILLVVFFLGCATLNQGPSVCETAPPESLLCKLAERLGMNLETLGESLQFASAVGIELGQYTVQDAIEVAKGLKENLQDPNITDIGFKKALAKYGKRHPLVVMTANKYFKSFDTGMKIPQWDIDTMIKWLDETLALYGE